MAAAAALALVCAVGSAQAPAARSVLLFPVRSHWLSAPLAESVAAMLSEELVASGFAVAPAGPDAPVVKRAISEGWVEGEELAGEGLEAARQVLAVVAGAGASLTAELVEGEAEVSLKVRLVGTVSREEASFEVSAPVGGAREEVARELARRAASAVVEELWSQAGADERGRRAAAAERYAAGRAALSQGMYREAVLELEGALIGEPDSGEYLWAAAEAKAAAGDYHGAMVRLRRLAALRPEDMEVALRLGEVALAAGEPERAEAAFLRAEELSAEEARAIEGAARSARARGDRSRSESYYERLLLLLDLGAARWAGREAGTGRVVSGRSLTGRCQSFPGTLARLSDDSIRLAGTASETRPLQLARLCLRAGEISDAVAALTKYHREAERPAYTEEEYLDVFPALDEESERIARGAQAIFAARAVGQLDNEEADAQMDGLHERSEALATLAERMAVSARLDPAHRYRVLAYNLLNEANFEALMFLRTEVPDRQRRAEVLRSAFRQARTQANELGEALLESQGERGGGPRRHPRKVTAG